jgi:methanogenic corrinoid protein MtbC1
MHDMREEPLFNLKAVVQQTGLKPDTLRAWERRYGIPVPQRSPGGHRLYSQRDISTIRWLMERQREGMSIKRAVELWRQISDDGRDPLRTTSPLAAGAVATPTPQVAGGTVAELRESWLMACLAYDEGTADQLLAQAFALYTPETVCLELLLPAMDRIGQGWYEGKVTVQQEHFCSAMAVRRVEALIMAAPLPTRPGRILAACPAGEQHTLGLLVMAWLLRRRGWEVIYLGADVPAGELGTTVAATRPQLVILSAQQLHSAATLLDTAHMLEQEDVPLAYGGLIFDRLPALRNRIPGHFLGERLESAPQAAELLLSARRAAPAVEPVPDSYRRAREHFGERLGLIESQLDRAPRHAGVAPDYLAIAGRELAINIDAALALGDMEFLGTDIDWLAGLLENHGLQNKVLGDYLTTYYQAAQQLLDERGQPVVDWLGSLVHERTSA